MSSSKELNTMASEMKRIRSIERGGCLSSRTTYTLQLETRNIAIPSCHHYSGQRFWVTNHLHEKKKKCDFELRTSLLKLEV